MSSVILRVAVQEVCSQYFKRILKLQGFSKMVMYLLFFYPEISPCQMETKVLSPACFICVLRGRQEMSFIMILAISIISACVVQNDTLVSNRYFLTSLEGIGVGKIRRSKCSRHLYRLYIRIPCSSIGLGSWTRDGRSWE